MTSPLSSWNPVTLAEQILPPLLTQNVYRGSKFKFRGTGGLEEVEEEGKALSCGITTSFILG